MEKRTGGTRQGRIIRASEIGQYTFCARAWWLSQIRGVPSTNTHALAQGEAVHQRHGRAVWTAGALRIVAFVFLIVAVVIVIAAVLGIL
ncbi:MAG: hypothetical protein M1546_15055 [Chloroflexi bacterium]|nr:hypothetical protein [Chloroflexota bacterium]